MTAFLVRRLALVLPTLFFVSVLIFGLQQLLPGDPALALAWEDRDPSVVAYLHEKYHLEEPLPVRYLLWVKGVLRGDFGESIRIKRPVRDLVLEKLPVTGELAALALIIALSIGIPMGVLSAVHNKTAIDHIATMTALWGISMPNFWLGILLILLFSVELGLLPASGFVSPGESLLRNLATLIMPAFVLGNAIAAVMMRHTRRAMLGVLSADYVRTARAKGLSERRVVLLNLLADIAYAVVNCLSADPGPGDTGDCRRDHRRGEPLLSRTRPAAAGSELGQHAEHRQGLPVAGALDGGVARASYLQRRSVVQSAW
jgi:peptide/nickel transport system permease protein